MDRKELNSGLVRIIVVMILALVLLGLWITQGNNNPTLYTYEIVNSFPHDPEAFTQGLVYHQGYLYEGTGLYGQSSLRRVRLQDGSVEKMVELPAEYFGEGITIFQERIYQLTWREQQGFVYELANFDQIASFTYSTEGWGLTHDGEHLIMSDGSNELTILDPNSFRPLRKVAVQEAGKPVHNLNELEYINGEIYANVWLTDYILRIDPSSGRVTGRIDLSGLLEEEYQEDYQVDVLNGIAYDPQGDRLFVTGKLWPRLYEIRLVLVD